MYAKRLLYLGSTCSYAEVVPIHSNKLIIVQEIQNFMDELKKNVNTQFYLVFFCSPVGLPDCETGNQRTKVGSLCAFDYC